MPPDFVSDSMRWSLRIWTWHYSEIRTVLFYQDSQASDRVSVSAFCFLSLFFLSNQVFSVSNQMIKTLTLNFIKGFAAHCLNIWGLYFLSFTHSVSLFEIISFNSLWVLYIVQYSPVGPPMLLIWLRVQANWNVSIAYFTYVAYVWYDQWEEQTQTWELERKK